MVEWFGDKPHVVISEGMLQRLGWTNKTDITIKELSFGILIHSMETTEDNSIRIEISEMIRSLSKDDLILVVDLVRRLA